MKRGRYLTFGVLLSLILGKALAAPTSHWAFLPIHASCPPAVPSVAWCRTPIDQFVLSRLAAMGGAPSSPAEPRTLLRRIYFDLIGLPPSPADAEHFLRAFGENPGAAVDALLDRLLASPHYGERWARWWLDVARYADTNGQDENKVMANAWRYRDWVVRAFNSNQRFDGFITEQIAGDLLPSAATERENADRLIATGFLVLGPKMLAEQDKPKLVMDIVDEQIDTVGRAFLGLTLGCARCHDHKFDPVPTRDYYALAGIFKSTRTMADLAFVSKFNERLVASKSELAAVERHQQQMLEQTNRIESFVKEANKALQEEARESFADSLLRAMSTNELANCSALASNQIPKLRDLLSLDSSVNVLSRRLRQVAASGTDPAAWLQRIEALPESGRALRVGPGRVGPGFYARGSNYLELAHTSERDPAELTVEAWVRADAFPTAGDARRWLVNKNGNEWTEGHYALMLDRDRPGAYLNIGGGRDNVFSVWSDTALESNRWYHLAFTYNGSNLELFVDGKVVGETKVGRHRVPGGQPLALGRRQDGYIAFSGMLDEVHVYDRVLNSAELRAHFAAPERVDREHLVASWDFNQLTPAERDEAEQADLWEALFGKAGFFSLPKDPRQFYPGSVRAELTSLEAERSMLEAAAPPSPAYALAVEEDKPIDLPVHLRGSHLNLAQDPVPRGFVTAVGQSEDHPVPHTQSGRLQLARWITDPANPLTARVIVNRIWQAHFGEGIVRTPDNFGIRGEAPTHPELLDWLAAQFIASGWDIKAMHRLILRSAVYLQSSRASGDPFERTTDPENRWLSHFPRQRLDAEMIRDSLLAVSARLDGALGGSPASWKNNEYVPGDEISTGSVRRTLYLPIVRDRVYDTLTIFDFANPSVCSARRTTTVVSHQALFFLNSPLVKDSAMALARQLMTQPGGTVTGRLSEAYLRVLGRLARPGEIERAQKFLAELSHYPGTKSGRERDEEDLAVFCQTLLASNEFVYRF